MQALQRLRKVGHHLVTFVPRDVADVGEIFFGIADESVEHRQRHRLVALEQRQVGGRAATVGDGPDSRFQLSYLSHCTPYA